MPRGVLSGAQAVAEPDALKPSVDWAGSDVRSLLTCGLRLETEQAPNLGSCPENQTLGHLGGGHMGTTLHSEAMLTNVRAKVGKSHISPSGEHGAPCVHA